jgi:methionyl-tRNA formyltransferase
MDAKPDRGDIVAQRAVHIAPDDTALTLTRKLCEAARLLVRETYPALVAGTAPRVAQDHARATYFGGRRPEDGRLAWEQPTKRLYDLVRAVTAPYPGAFTTWRASDSSSGGASDGGPRTAPRARCSRSGREGVVVAAGRGALLLERVQLGERARGAGGRDGAANRLAPGERLGEAR